MQADEVVDDILVDYDDPEVGECPQAPPADQPAPLGDGGAPRAQHPPQRCAPAESQPSQLSNRGAKHARHRQRQQQATSQRKGSAPSGQALGPIIPRQPQASERELRHAAEKRARQEEEQAHQQRRRQLEWDARERQRRINSEERSILLAQQVREGQRTALLDLQCAADTRAQIDVLRRREQTVAGDLERLSQALSRCQATLSGTTLQLTKANEELNARNIAYGHRTRHYQAACAHNKHLLSLLKARGIRDDYLGPAPSLISIATPAAATNDGDE